ncbi:MAG TPA: hypothetical protein VNS88_16700 [Nitrospiraceae bacterium]|nr:hypothetical protein [Nitrospiraceae bacterium]
MGTTFGDMKALVLTETNRGRNKDVVAAVPGRINMAISWLEKNYNCQHMKKYQTFELDPGMQWPRSLDIPLSLKSVRVIRRLNCCRTGTPGIVELTRVDPESLPPDRGDDILSWWPSGREKIWFDNTPQVTTRFEWIAHFYTGQIADDNVEHFLFEVAQDFIIGKSMQLLGPFMRDVGVIQAYKPMAEEGLQTFLSAEGAIEDEGGRDDLMVYGEVYSDYTHGGAVR